NTRPEFEFLRQKKFRIKAQKYLNKFISEGIIFPLSILPSDIFPNEGLDVTDSLGIVKVIEDEEDIATNASDEETETISYFEKKLNHAFMRYAWYRILKKEIKGEKIRGVWPVFGPPQSKETNIQEIFTKIKE